MPSKRSAQISPKKYAKRRNVVLVSPPKKSPSGSSDESGKGLRDLGSPIVPLSPEEPKRKLVFDDHQYRNVSETPQKENRHEPAHCAQTGIVITETESGLQGKIADGKENERPLFAPIQLLEDRGTIFGELKSGEMEPPEENSLEADQLSIKNRRTIGVDEKKPEQCKVILSPASNGTTVQGDNGASPAAGLIPSLISTPTQKPVNKWKKIDVSQFENVRKVDGFMDKLVNFLQIKDDENSVTFFVEDKAEVKMNRLLVQLWSQSLTVLAAYQDEGIMSPTKQLSDDGRVHLPHLSLKAFETMTKFFGTGNLQASYLELPLILQCAEYCMIPALVGICKQRLRREFHPVESFSVCAQLYKVDEDLADFVLRTITHSVKEIIKMEDNLVRKLTRKDMLALVNTYELPIPEWEIYNFVIRWGKLTIGVNLVGLDLEHRRSVLGEYLGKDNLYRKLRFGDYSQYDIITGPISDVMSDEEKETWLNRFMLRREELAKADAELKEMGFAMDDRAERDVMSIPVHLQVVNESREELYQAVPTLKFLIRKDCSPIAAEILFCLFTDEEVLDEERGLFRACVKDGYLVTTIACMKERNVRFLEEWKRPGPFYQARLLPEDVIANEGSVLTHGAGVVWLRTRLEVDFVTAVPFIIHEMLISTDDSKPLSDAVPVGVVTTGWDALSELIKYWKKREGFQVDLWRTCLGLKPAFVMGSYRNNP